MDTLASIRKAMPPRTKVFKVKTKFKRIKKINED